MDIKDLQHRVGNAFQDAFGRTSLRQRLQDIRDEATELQRWTDLNHLREESGDLLASLLAFFHETQLDPEQAIDATLDKIKKREQQYRSLGRKIKVALFGGAFDPPTLGHIAAAKFVLEATNEFDEVFLVPCYRHMYNKKMASPEHRLAMLQIATRVDKRIKVFDYEIVNQLAGETYHFVKSLQNSPWAETHQFSYVIGTDNADNFNRWVNFEELERLIRFVVVARTGQEWLPGTLWYMKPPHIFLRPEQPLPETSSTEARNMIQNPYDRHDSRLGKMMDLEVLQYALDHQLYSS